MVWARMRGTHFILINPFFPQENVETGDVTWCRKAIGPCEYTCVEGAFLWACRKSTTASYMEINPFFHSISLTFQGKDSLLSRLESRFFSCWGQISNSQTLVNNEGIWERGLVVQLQIKEGNRQLLSICQ